MRHTEPTRRILMGAMLGGSALLGLAARPAEACSYPATPVALDGYPGDGALDVPTDVRPIYNSGILGSSLAVEEAAEDAQAAEDSDASRLPVFELVDDAGAILPLGTAAVGGLLELAPAQVLAPQTHYLLRRRAQAGESTGLELSFTTGDGALGTVPEPPLAAIQHYTLESSNATSCSPLPTGTCVAFDEPASGVYFLVRPFESGRAPNDFFAQLSRKPGFRDIAGVRQQTPFDCLELRSRALNGLLSAPLTLCREDGPRYDLHGSEDIACTADGITQDGRLVSKLPRKKTADGIYTVPPPSEAGGCALSAPARSRTGLLGLLPVLIVGLRRRARARRAQ